MLLGLDRVAMAGGKSIPYDREVAYLAADGNQYIDLGIKGYSGIGFDVKFAATAGSSSIGCVIGYVFTLTSGKGMVLRVNQAGIGRSIALFSDEWVGNVNYAYGDIFVVSARNGSLKIGDSEFTYTEKINTGGNWFLFGAASGYRLVPDFSWCLIGRIYYLKLYNTDGTVKFDFIPVVKDGVGCFYNKAYTADGAHGEQFYYNTSGSGAFTWGELSA